MDHTRVEACLLQDHHGKRNAQISPGTRGVRTDRYGGHVWRSGRCLHLPPALAVALAVAVGLAASGCGDRPDGRPGRDQSGSAWTRVTLLERDPDSSVPLRTANVRVADVDGDGSLGYLVSEPTAGRLVWLRNCDVDCDPLALAEGLGAPVRVHPADLDADGASDLLVADIGALAQTDAPVGRVVLLVRTGPSQFRPEVLLDEVGRVACAETGDLDADGDLDVIACIFGHRTGALVWLEQKAGRFVRHDLRAEPGAIHAFPFDADGDGDLDIAAVFSQNLEEITLFRGDGAGSFTQEALFTAETHLYGLSGIELTDLDQDGDVDILVTNGDYFDAVPVDYADLDALHGLAWLENDGSGQFDWHDILRTLGAYSVRALDVDDDGDLDLLLSALRNEDILPPTERATRGLWLLRNDGEQNFAPTPIVDGPSHIITLDTLPETHGPAFVAGSYPLGSVGPEHRRLELFTAVRSNR